MSRPKYYWYPVAKRMVMQYPILVQRNINGDIENDFIDAVQKAIAETEKEKDGKYRLIAIDFVLFKQTKTICGVAQELHYSERTIQSYINDFIRLVGRYVGFACHQR